MNTNPKLETTYKKLEELIPNPRNARTHSQKQIKKIAKSIQQFGFTTSILIDKENTIIAGHGRFEAAKLLNLEEVPVTTLANLSKEQIKAYMLVDNKLAEEAGWDKEILQLELQELMNLDYDFDITLTGFDIPEIDFIVSDEKHNKKDKADIMPEKEEIKAVVNSGDLWKLGEHYLHCGNALYDESYKILLGQAKAKMIFTDPPYNVKINGHVCGKGKIKHSEFLMASGEMKSEEFAKFLDNIFANLKIFSTNGSIHFIFMDWRHIKEVLDAGLKNYDSFINLCVWNKLQGGMGSLYRSQHELVFVFKNGTESHINNIELGKHGRFRTNVWEYKGISATNPHSLDDLKYHPTCKPISLIMDAIRDCSNIGDIILDPFAGSGTTLLAAERTGRKAYVMELDPHYCDVIIHRYEKLVGKKAVKLDCRKGNNHE